MLQWHITITLKCEETNEEVSIEINGKESIVNVEIWDVVVSEKSELFSQSFVGLLETFGLTQKFMKELEDWIK
jgi:DNA-binding protein YbaB